MARRRDHDASTIPWAKLTDAQAAAVSLMLVGAHQRDAARLLGISRWALRVRLEAAARHLPEETHA